MTNSFLTPAELGTLTGYKLPGKQIAWLRDKRVPHKINAAGRPVVAWSWINKLAPEPTPELAEVR